MYYFRQQVTVQNLSFPLGIQEFISEYISSPDAQPDTEDLQESGMYIISSYFSFTISLLIGSITIKIRVVFQFSIRRLLLTILITNVKILQSTDSLYFSFTISLLIGSITVKIHAVFQLSIRRLLLTILTMNVKIL